MRALVFTCFLSMLLMGCPADEPAGGTPLDATDSVATDLDTVEATDLHTADVTDLNTEATDLHIEPDAQTPDGPTLTIVVEGNPEPSGDPAASSQTPSPYFYGLQRLELLRAKDDADPVVIFDYAPADVQVDMHTQNVVAEVPMADLPNDSFTYFRIVLTRLEATVNATLHEVPVVGTLTTPVDLVYALSDTEHDGKAMAQGDARVTINVAGNAYTVPTHWPVTYPEPAPGAWAESINGTSRVTFALVPALTVSANSLQDLTYVIRYHVAGGFEWIDADDPASFKPGIWDIELGTPPTAETVVRFGATAYEVFRKEE